MSYLVLARRYRPQTFDEVIGQEHVTRTLYNAIQTDHLAQAFLFSGTRGVGKTTAARILAGSKKIFTRAPAFSKSRSPRGGWPRWTWSPWRTNTSSGTNRPSPSPTVRERRSGERNLGSPNVTMGMNRSWSDTTVVLILFQAAGRPLA